MGKDKCRLTSFIFMAAALAVLCFSLYYSFALTAEVQNLAMTVAILLFLIGHTGILYTILDRLPEKEE